MRRPNLGAWIARKRRFVACIGGATLCATLLSGHAAATGRTLAQPRANPQADATRIVVAVDTRSQTGVVATLQPAFDGRRMIFASLRGSVSHLWASETDGSGLRRLDRGQFYGSWSGNADATRAVLFNPTNTEITRVDALTGGFRRNRLKAQRRGNPTVVFDPSDNLIVETGALHTLAWNAPTTSRRSFGRGLDDGEWAVATTFNDSPYGAWLAPTGLAWCGQTGASSTVGTPMKLAALNTARLTVTVSSTRQTFDNGYGQCMVSEDGSGVAVLAARKDDRGAQWLVWRRHGGPVSSMRLSRRLSGSGVLSPTSAYWMVVATNSRRCGNGGSEVTSMSFVDLRSRHIRSVRSRFPGAVVCNAFSTWSSDDSTLAVLEQHGHRDFVRIVEPATGDSRRIAVPGPSSASRWVRLTFIPGRRKLLVSTSPGASRQAEWYLIDVDHGERLHLTPDDPGIWQGAGLSVSFSRDEAWFVGDSRDGASRGEIFHARIEDLVAGPLTLSSEAIPRG